MKKHSLIAILSCLLCSATVAKANTLGFGITGSYGFNLLGFKSTLNGTNSQTGIGQLFSYGTFIEYNIGEDANKEPLAISLDLAYAKRIISVKFSRDEANKAPRYYDQTLKNFTLDCFDFQFNIFLQAIRFDHGCFGPYAGFGGYYMLRGGHADRDLKPTDAQCKDVEDNLTKLNLLASAGIKSKFLDNLLALSLGATYSFMDQYKGGNSQNRLKSVYGDNISIGNGQICIVSKLTIDIWQMIIG